MSEKPYKLGKTLKGEKLDLAHVFDFISINGKKFYEISEQFLNENPELKQAAEDASEMYYKILSSLPIISQKKPSLIQQHLRLNDTEMLLADRGAMLLIVGATHYLEWIGFNIENPTSFEEINTKLSEAIQPALRIIIDIIIFEKWVRFINHHDLFSNVLSSPLKKCYSKSFETGISFGFLIAYAHFNGVGALVNFFGADYEETVH